MAILQAALSIKGFFLITDTFPPRLFLIIGPPLLLILLAFTTERGRTFVSTIDLKVYTYLHTIRIGVEIVLLWLFMQKLIPQSMTFEGRNFDILSGITAPLIAYFGFQTNKLNKRVLLGWNVICLILVLQVVITGVLSAPTVFQKFSFDQPNWAVLYFPFVWLPGIVVPIVIFGHLVAIRRLGAI
jgi:hypothetical protein